MQNRTKAFLLIGSGVLIIIAVLLWLFWPMLQRQVRFTQPPGYTEGNIPTEPLQVAPAPAAPRPAAPAELESRRLEDKLRRMAQDFASRAGTYSNTDDFAALRDASLEANAEVRTFFLKERTRLTQAHPLRGGAWGQTVQGLASRIVSLTPIGTQSSVTIEVETKVVTEDGEKSPATSYRNAEITYERSGTNWAVARIEWQEQ